MSKFNRNSREDAEKVFKRLVPNDFHRDQILNFMWNAMEYANAINAENWNLNMAENGNFVRFNTGHPYCIQIKKKEILVLCDRQQLRIALKNKHLPITFLGHTIKKKHYSKKMDEVPDCIVKADSNVGCILSAADLAAHSSWIKKPNKFFIESAIKSKQIRIQRTAHSRGAVEYLLNLYGQRDISESMPLDKFYQEEEKKLETAEELGVEKRRELLKKSDPKPEQIFIKTRVFKRNEYVKAEVLERADGHCQKCSQPAPFLCDGNNRPYLEVHHKIRLAEGGDDTVENAIALCPNCHRHAHYGTNTY